MINVVFQGKSWVIKSILALDYTELMCLGNSQSISCKWLGNIAGLFLNHLFE